MVDPELPEKQAGFRRGHINTQYIIKLISDIEDSFERANKTGVILVDLTAAYDTEWHRGLVPKLLQKIPAKQMVRFLTNILANRSFVLRTSDGQSINVSSFKHAYSYEKNDKW